MLRAASWTAAVLRRFSRANSRDKELRPVQKVQRRGCASNKRREILPFQPQAGHYTTLRAAFADVSNCDLFPPSPTGRCLVCFDVALNFFRHADIQSNFYMRLLFTVMFSAHMRGWNWLLSAGVATRSASLR